MVVDDSVDAGRPVFVAVVGLLGPDSSSESSSQPTSSSADAAFEPVSWILLYGK